MQLQDRAVRIELGRLAIFARGHRPLLALGGALAGLRALLHLLSIWNLEHRARPEMLVI